MPTSLDPDLGTIAHDEVVDWAESVALADAELMGHLTGGASRPADETVHKHHTPESLGPKDLVVRLRTQVGGVSQHFKGVEPVTLQGMLLASRHAVARRVFFAEAAARLFEVWTGGAPDLADAAVEQPVKRTRIQQAPRWADDLERWFLTHTYQLIVRPQ